MIKRILLGAIGVLAAAVMISAATHAIDFEQTTIEDGDGRYAIAVAAAAVFLLCMYLLISDLAQARSAGELPDAADTGPATSSDPGSLADRFAATRAAEQAAASNPDVRSARIVTVSPTSPPVADALADEVRGGSNLSNQGSSGRGLFGVAAPAQRPATADGLFGRRTPTQPPSTERGPVERPVADATPMAAPTPMAPPEPVPAPRPAPQPEPASPANPSSSEPITLRDYLPDAVEPTVEPPPVIETPPPTARVEVADARPTADDLRTLLFATPEGSAAAQAPDAAAVQMPADTALRIDTAPPIDGDRLDHDPLDGSHLDDALPTWQVIDDPADGVDGDGLDDGSSDDDDPPPSGYLYATGGH